MTHSKTSQDAPGGVQITAEYGRKFVVSDAQMDAWLDDLPEQIDEIMAQPLRVGDDSAASLSRFAFCAPEVIRGAVAGYILKTNLQNEAT